MSEALVTLAIESAAIVASANKPERAKELQALIADYIRAARGDGAVEAYTFAERSLRRAEREKTRVEPLAPGAPTKDFAAERLRQIDEIVKDWNGDQPARNTAFVKGLRNAFDNLKSRG